MITKEEFEEYKEARNEVYNVQYGMADYIYEILEGLCKLFGAEKPRSVHFMNAEAGEVGDPSFTANHIEYVFAPKDDDGGKVPKNMVTSEHGDLTKRLPTKYLHMTVADVVKDVQLQINHDKDVEKRAQERLEKLDFNDGKLLESIKDKLTTQELKVLGL